MSIPLDERVEILGPRVSMRAASAMTWMIRPLVNELGSRMRLRRWADDGCPHTDAHKVTYVGDEKLGDAVRRVLARVPPPVRTHVVHNVMVAGVGLASVGWQQVLCSLPAAVEAPQLIVLSANYTEDEEIAALVAHEVGHAWRAPLWQVGKSPALECLNAANAILSEQIPIVSAGIGRAREELAVVELGRAWGFYGRSTNYEQYSRRLREAQRRVEETAE